MKNSDRRSFIKKQHWLVWVWDWQAPLPAHIEEHHPDLFWYGVHGVEILFTIMGSGCKHVKRTFTKNTDVVVGIWEDDRIGSYRGIREGKGGYGSVMQQADYSRDPQKAAL